MKIDFRPIVRDHLATLHAAGASRVAPFDIALFFGLPAVLGGLAFWLGFCVEADAYNVSITFFGIFIALLLNIQVAIFSIFQRKWEVPSDKRLATIQEETLKKRRRLLGELNSNISYLTLVCFTALVAFLILFVFKWTTGVAPALGILVYAHFMMTLLMVIKRAHALFQMEYRGASSG